MDDYENITRIGKGACGSVYLVRNRQSQKLYALKKIQLDEGRKTRTKEAVMREVKILSQLKHPNIVAYFDYFIQDDDEYLCIIQDYCDGGTLDDKICSSKVKKDFFPEKQIMQWFIQIAMAVQYMHSKKILHRDLKTQNVFMTKTGMTCKLGDFGISKMLDQTVEAAQTCVGTPCYLSPEMCQDIPYTSKADVWALGCLLYEMCALRPAFEAQNLISLFYKIVRAEYENIPDVYSSQLFDVIKSILVKSPDDRPSARGVLNLSYIRDRLSHFIEEKQYILQLKQLKDSPNTTIDRQTVGKRARACSSPLVPRKYESQRSESPPLPSRLPTSRHEGDSSIQLTADPPVVSVRASQDCQCSVCGKNFRMRSWLLKHLVSKHGESGDSVQASPSSKLTSQAELPVPSPSPQRRGVETEYPDDFDEDSEDSEEDIPEELPDGEAAADISDSDVNSISDEGDSEPDYDYPDDFEEYASEDELDKVVSHAKNAQRRSSGYSNDEMVVCSEGSKPSIVYTCKNLIEEHCIAALGRDRYEEVKKLSDKSGYDLDLRPTFERMAGSEHVETCFLVTEMLAENG